MKKDYEKPEIDIEEFEVEDVITSSSLTNGGAGISDDRNWSQLQ